MISLDFLENIELFKGLDDNQLAAIQECSEKIEYQRGDRLFAEGEESNHLWIVKAGQIDLRFDRPEGRPASKEDPISFISEANLFGWSSFIPPYKYRLSGYCASRKCEVVRVEKERLSTLFKKDARIGYLIMSYVLQVIGKHFFQFQGEIAKRRGHNILSGW
jgi:CRP-like cAMP-binding protein